GDGAARPSRASGACLAVSRAVAGHARGDHGSRARFTTSSTSTPLVPGSGVAGAARARRAGARLPGADLEIGMGGKVTALDMDVVTENSGHPVSPLAPSVCTTPAAPAPVPVPYPVAGTSAAGVIGAPSRTRINGAKVGSVGGCVAAVHGNEPGTLKEIVSMTT